MVTVGAMETTCHNYRPTSVSLCKMAEEHVQKLESQQF